MRIAVRLLDTAHWSCMVCRRLAILKTHSKLWPHHRSLGPITVKAASSSAAPTERGLLMGGLLVGCLRSPLLWGRCALMRRLVDLRV